MSESECPTCGDTFSTSLGMKGHHTRVHGESLTQKTVMCDACGDEITMSRSRFERSDRFFCNEECMSEGKSGEMEGEDNPWYNSKIVECGFCGDDLELPVSRIEQSERNFCDTVCRSEWWSEYQSEHQPNLKQVEVECANCGDTLSRPPSRVKNHENQLCDMKCQGEWRESLIAEDAPQFKQITTNCSYCGEEIKRQRAKYNRYDNHFCKQSCESEWKSENLTGDNHPRYKPEKVRKYGKGWNEKKKRSVRERDGFECVYCGLSQEEQYDKYGNNLNVHHIIKAVDVVDPEIRNGMENLETTCSSCHCRVEWLYPLRPSNAP